MADTNNTGNDLPDDPDEGTIPDPDINENPEEPSGEPLVAPDDPPLDSGSDDGATMDPETEPEADPEPDSGSENPFPPLAEGDENDNPEEGEPSSPEDIGDNDMTAPGSTTVTDDFNALRGAQAKLIRKALGGLILVASEDAEVPEKIFTGPNTFADFAALGYKPLGWLTKGDGINFTRETEQAEVESFGAQEPTRIDFTKDVTSAAFKCQETNRQVLEMYHGVDLEDVTVDKDTGEFAFSNPDIPEAIYRRLIYIAKDGNGDDAKYIIKVMPRGIVSEVQEQAWSSESELASGLTVKATKDDVLGYSVRNIFGGTGFLKLAEDMGFELST